MAKDVEPTEKKTKQVKDKRQKKLGTKILSGTRGNFAAAGLVGLGAMINYVSVGTNGPSCGVGNFDQKEFETSFEPTN